MFLPPRVLIGFLFLSAVTFSLAVFGYNTREMMIWGEKSLKEVSPGAYQVFKDTERRDFSQWLTGNDASPVDDLLTAVHESAHHRTGATNKYMMIDGEEVPYIGYDRRLLPPSVIGNEVPNSIYRDTYLRDKSRTAATSNTQLAMLLDEFNCYIHDADLSNKLYSRTPEKWKTINYWNGSEGVFAFMTYLQKYLEKSRRHPKAWSALKERRFSEAIRKIWSHAEAVAAENCRIGGNEKKRPELRVHLDILCESRHRGLDELLERPSRGCAQSCRPSSETLVAAPANAPIKEEAREFTPPAEQDESDLFHFGSQ